MEKKTKRRFTSLAVAASMLLSASALPAFAASSNGNGAGYDHDVDTDGKLVFNDGTKLNWRTHNDDPVLMVNGDFIPSAELTMVNDRTLVPIRVVAETLGATVTWDELTNSATLKATNGKTVKLQIGSKVAIIDGVAKSLDVAARLYKDKTYVPLRFVSEAFGAVVGYEEDNGVHEFPVVWVESAEATAQISAASKKDWVSMIKKAFADSIKSQRAEGYGDYFYEGTDQAIANARIISKMGRYLCMEFPFPYAPSSFSPEPHCLIDVLTNRIWCIVYQDMSVINYDLDESVYTLFAEVG